MTKEQLDAIRARVEAGHRHQGCCAVEARENLRALLAEVERLTALTEETEAQMHMRIRAGYDKTVADAWRAEVKKQSTFAFARGVAAMREVAAKECWNTSDELANIPDMETEQGALQNVAYRIRTLPDPEDKP